MTSVSVTLKRAQTRMATFAKKIKFVCQLSELQALKRLGDNKKILKIITLDT